MDAVDRMFGFSLLILAIFHFCQGENIPGVVPLNSATFDKILPKFKAVLVKFDESYPYGDKQDAFKEMAKITLSNKEILMAEVHVADYGEKENQDLADRFKLTKDDLPTYILFTEGKQPARYKGDVKQHDEIKKFLMRESGLWLGLPACIEEFDLLLKDFFKSDFKAEREKIVVKAQGMADLVKEEDRKARAQVYVKTMQKVIEKGNDFIDQEIARVDKLRTEKVSEKKKDQLRDRSSILTSFQMRMKGELLTHEEL